MTVQYVFLAGVASLLTIWIIISYDQIGKLYQFVYLYADKLNCVVKTEKRFILHENLKNPAHLNEIPLLFNHHSDVRKTQEKYRGRAMSTFSVFSLDVLLLIYLSKIKDNASAEPMTDPGGGGVTLKQL